MKKNLLINPWIYDFAAYDMGMKPLGLLRVGAHLRRHSEVSLIDCLSGCARSKRESGFSKLRKVRVEKPAILEGIERPYFRYGIPVDDFRDKLAGIEEPAAVYVASGMTYWYPGVQHVIRIVKEFFPKAPVTLGGIYATICFEHALEHSGSDYVWRGAYGEESGIIPDIPAYDLLEERDVLPVRMSTGCPFGCSYCASNVLHPAFVQRDPVKVFEELMYCRRTFGTKTFVFYDDALLFRKDAGIKKLLRIVAASGETFRFYTPNGLHARFIDQELACLMKEAGFRDLRLSLETSDREVQHYTGSKVSNEEAARAVLLLKEAGFDKEDIGMYLLVGAPWLDLDRTRSDILFVNSLNARALLALYSPIPKTNDYRVLVESGIIEEGCDPLWHNNTVFSERLEPGMIEQIKRLRRFVSEINSY